jgi:methanogenic corrinoid protein MtbC1
MEIYERIAEEVVKGQAASAKELVRQALSQNISAEDILNNGLIEGMNVVSEKFKNNEFFIPEVLVAARASNLFWRRPTSKPGEKSSSVLLREIFMTSGKTSWG